MKFCLTVAGSDCSGGAGIQADLKTFAANGVYGASVLTSVVAENTSRVLSIHNIPTHQVAAQIDAVFEDIKIDAVKLGMLPTAEIVQLVGEKLMTYKPEFVVCDPVLVATSGDRLSADETVNAYKKYIFPVADILTPNIPEAQAFTNTEIKSVDDMRQAAKMFCEMGAKRVVVKGGHLTDKATDIMYDGTDFSVFEGELVDSPNTHGTGCTLSSAITAFLAKGEDFNEAVAKAKNYVYEAIEKSYTVGKGHSPVHHFFKWY